MKSAAKTTLNSMDEVLHEINTLVDQQEKEDYAKIFMVKSNLNLTYQSNYYLEIMEITTTLQHQTNTWSADVTF
ncbi:MAG: hypothetical protein ACOVO2_13080 [Emticicia sp.]|uniref:hypothetical protein n=1 Tax=Emticicia sp. TaxID=1930953 RepID=UPI003BA76718